MLLPRVYKQMRALYLHRYAMGDGGKCWLTGNGIHNAIVRIEDGPLVVNAEGYSESISVNGYLNDPRWPTSCLCGYLFREEDERQIFQDHPYRRSLAGQVIPLRDSPQGAMWNAWWMAERQARGLPAVKLPNDSGSTDAWGRQHADGNQSDDSREIQ